MYLSKHRVGELSRSHIDSFGGYDHNIRIADNEFYDMKNLTSTYYPTLSPRDRRGAVKQISDCNGLLAKDKLAYVEGNTLHYGDFTMELKSYITGERQLVSMGAYLIVFPDMMYVNTADLADFGACYKNSVLQKLTNVDQLEFSLCDENGNEIMPTFVKTPDGEVFGRGIDEYRAVYEKYYGSYGSSDEYYDYDGFLVLHKGDTALVVSGEDTSNSYYLYNGNNLDNVECWSEYKQTEDGGYYEYYVKALKDGWTDLRYTINGGTDDFHLVVVRIKSSDSPEASNTVSSYHNLTTPADSLLEFTENEIIYSIYDGTQWVKQDVSFKTKIKVNGESGLADALTARSFAFLRVAGESEYFKFFLQLLESGAVVKLTDKDSANNSMLISAPIWGKDYFVASATTVDEGWIYDDEQGKLVKNVKEVIEGPEVTLTFYDAPPLMDYLIESNNRLWGCRYGLNRDGEFVNEIYASALGEFGTWNKYDGTSQDSYTVSLGTDGAFTGAVNFRGQPMFFKENCCHTVYGYYPQSYQMLTDTGMGLQKGSGKSLCIIQNVLYYKALDGIYRYDGSSADRISDALGQTVYSEAVGGGIDSKYYVAMTAENGTRELFVLDITKGLWHKEDDAPVRYFARYGGDLWFWRADTQSLCTVKGTEGELEAEDIEWFAETGIIGYSTHDAKYVGNLQLRIMLPVGSSVQFYIEYDSDGYMELKGSIEGKSFRAFTIPIIPRRCDHFRIRITGTGPCRIYSFSKILEQGGEI